MKRFKIFTVVIAVLSVPSLMFAADAVAPGVTSTNADNTVTVPLEIANQDGLMAIDIPLEFSEGVTLQRVDFKDTRVEYFDLKLASIDNDKNTVVVGLVTQTSPEAKELLPAGEGTVANLIFSIDDPSVSEITLEAITLENPHHSMTFIYNLRDESDGGGQVRSTPEFNPSTVSLSGVSEGLPTSFALDQNYPNPFNPIAHISFSLPVASTVNLTVYNLLGQEVKIVVNGEMEPGVHEVTWDGTNGAGDQVSSGIYFYRLEANDFVATKKMMLLK
ncbi:MAG: T9SS type A sorting domain-containing protein [Candidatus Zixiibacteriota bacterium]|nr:MAG: T9SS type A sorting domain-containing protein [candidate division Zixibacteria bacterium]